MARPCFPANIWKNVIHEKMKFSFLQQEFFVVFAFYQKGLSIALPCLLVNLNKSMGLRLEFAIRNMRLCCTLAHCSTSTSVKTNRPIGHLQKKHWTCGPKMTKFILKKWSLFKSAMTWPGTCMFFSRYKVYNFSYLHHSNQFGIWNVPSDKVCEN